MPEQGSADRAQTNQVDLSLRRTVHVVGVGGAGMSAIATVLAGMGHEVSGSDLKESAGLDRLRSVGVAVYVGHDPSNLPGSVELVAASTAVPSSNVELRAAADRSVPVLRRADILASIAAQRRTVAVAGTHGKTTTSSMLAMVLAEAGLEPSFVIGADLNEVGSGAAWGRGEWAVIEADESDGTFLELPRDAAVITNVEPDHIEHYGSVEALEAAFAAFLDETGGPVLLCADDPGAAALASLGGRSGTARILTYGTSPGADFRMVQLVTSPGPTRFELVHDGEVLGQIELALPGAHNARNACAAVSTALVLGVPFEPARAALSRFAGVSRRFERRGAVGGVSFVDDYAHLPTEVAAAIGAAADGPWERVVAVFQPHRYSRTASLAGQFSEAFVEADLVVVTDVYAAGEAPRPGVTGKLVLDAVLDAHPRTAAAYMPHRSDVIRFLTSRLRAGDLCLTLGAGDVTSLPEELAKVMVEDPR